jgi:hypothetical protein
LTHALEQDEKPLLQLNPVQLPLLHTGVALAGGFGQAIPQPPQLFTLDDVSTQLSPQMLCPAVEQTRT